MGLDDKADSTRREDIAAAFDRAEAGTATTAPSAPVVPAPAAKTSAPAPSTAAAKAASDRDDKGRFKGGKAAAAAPAEPEAAPEPEESAVKTEGMGSEAPVEDEPEAEAKEEKPAEPELKAPPSWKPAAREHWAAAPKEVQQEVLRREAEMSARLSKSAAGEKMGQGFSQVVQPYGALLQGSDPLKAAAGLFQTAATLRLGKPETKAELVANIITGYGVDLKMLDEVLTQKLGGGAPAAAAGQAQQASAQPQAPMQDPRLDALLAQIEGERRQRAETHQAEAASEVESWGSGKEFFDDLRQDMADIMELAVKRKVPLTLDEAYERAARINPEIYQVFSQRQAAKAAKEATAKAAASTQRSRQASASVRSTLGAAPAANTEPQTVRESLEAAWDQHTST